MHIRPHGGARRIVAIKNRPETHPATVRLTVPGTQREQPSAESVVLTGAQP